MELLRRVSREQNALMFFQKYFRYIVIALLALLYLGSVWQRPLYIDTEFRQAEIAREMTATAPMPGFCEIGRAV